MNFKLALNNVKKSMKNYAIYFLTLSIAVCIFYAFNSVGAQGKLLGTTGDKEIIEAIGTVIGYISVFVSIVLGCLIIYANNFLIKRRKRELGLYMSLGMGKGKISKILVLEEFIIGIVSLICGLLGGIVLSQFLGLLTIKLFSVGAEKFSLVISVPAIIQTIIYFGIIFILVMIFNVMIVSKYKLIDLLTAHKKNEKIKIKSPLVSGLIFIISIGMLLVAYKLVIKSGLVNIQTTDFKMSIVLGVVGTILFFYGFTGFIILVIQKIKGVYYRKLNIFTVKQMNSKINTNFISMAVICLMLFITISLISVSVGFKSQNISRFTPFDATISTYVSSKNNTLEKVIKNNEIKLPQGCSYSLLDTKIMDGQTMEKVLGSSFAPSEKQMLGGNTLTYFISLSQYNKNQEIQGKKTVSLGENDAIVVSNVTMINKSIANLKEKNKLNINGKEFNVVSYSEENLITSQMANSSFIVVVNDNVLKNTWTINEELNINYNNNKESEKFLTNEFNKQGILRIGEKGNDEVVLGLMTKDLANQGQSQMTSMILYIAMYIGVIFLVSSAAVLSLQQLSEASDSYDRYVALRKIGASKKAINKTIFTQTLTYFGLPLILALVHSTIGIYVSEELISNFGKSSIVNASLMTMGVIIVIYAGYFIVTYLGYKNIVKEK
ncbi:MAG: FtsX-like permease family protein [Clostridium sp.]|uniref:FtsX-like permease family protein n=1 Tax=Clostridium sp. TaxID=1506 RepID=UPI003F3BCB94